MAPHLRVDRGDIRENVIIETVNINAPPTLPDPLRPHVAYEAMHDSGEVDAQGDCHPGTRIAIQEIIKRWVEDPRPNILVNLMIGAAGAGKSAIMRTIAKVLEEEGKLLGGFFCFRSSKRRNDGSLVIPTLIAQIIKRIPHLRPLVYRAFEEDEGLLTKAMDIQALKLIIEPLNSIDPIEHPQWPYVVLLDGLDEINGVAAQQAIVRVFAYINRHLVSPLHFLVASRPEPPILHAFDKFLGNHYNLLELDESLEPDKDIDIFYIDHFQAICDLNPRLPLGWPGAPVRQILVEKGSGKFIFASVVVGVVGDPTSPLSPQERLDLVMEVTKRDDLRPLERLDLLYVTVLNQIPDTVRPQVLRILSVILAAGNTLERVSPTPRFFDALFCTPSGTTRHRLCNLHSVLEIPADDGHRISPQHATLGDFIFDKARSEQFGFHVDKVQLVEDTVLQIAVALQSNPDKMFDASSSFLEFFNTQMEHQVSRSSLVPKLIHNLQSYQLTTLSPLALIIVAGPLALIIESSPIYLRFRNVSRSITKEGHRRARFYCNDYGRSGATLLVLYALYCAKDDRDKEYPPYILRYLDELCGDDERATIMSVDRTFGLGLTYWKLIGSNWTIPWSPWVPWLHSYRHLLVRPDIIAELVRLRGLWHPLSLRDLAMYWRHLLPFDRLTISGLRGILSSAQPENDGPDFGEFLLHINYYIRHWWKRRWYMPSLFLLRRDWLRQKEALEKAKRGWKLEQDAAFWEAMNRVPLQLNRSPTFNSASGPDECIIVTPDHDLDLDLDPNLDPNPNPHPID